MEEDHLSEVSPIPSPHGPPIPMSMHEDYHSVEVSSLPSLLDVPSPFSRPSSSLLSGQLPEKKERPRLPLTEVTLTSERANGGRIRTTAEEEEEEEVTLDPFMVVGHPQQEMESLPTLSSAQRVLPAAISLKRNLQTSNESLYLLQEENLALNAECDAFSARLAQWEAKATDQARQGRQQEQEWRRKLAQKEEQYQKETLERTKQHEAQIEKLNRQIQSWNQTKEEKLSQNTRKLEQALEAKQKEADSWKEDLSKTRAAFQEKVKSLNAEIAQLSQTQTRNEKQTIPKLQARIQSLTTEKSLAEAARDQVVEEKAILQGKLEQAEARALAQSRDNQNLSDTLAQARKDQPSRQLEMDRLQAIVKESKLTLKKTVSSTNAQIKDLQQRNEELEAAIQTFRSKQGTSVACQTETVVDHHPPQQPEPVFFEEVPPPPGLTRTASQTSGGVSARLIRIRDSVERVHLDQKYRREMIRLKHEHDLELKAMTTDHEQILKQVTQEAKQETNSKAREYKKRLQSEYEAEMEELGRKHDEEIANLKAHLQSDRELAEKSLEETNRQLDSTVNELERESQLRANLELQVEELQSRLAREGHRNSRMHETESLIVDIQKECNAVFDRRRQTNVRWVLPPTISESPSAPKQPSIWRDGPAVSTDDILDQVEHTLQKMSGVDVSA